MPRELLARLELGRGRDSGELCWLPGEKDRELRWMPGQRVSAGVGGGAGRRTGRSYQHLAGREKDLAGRTDAGDGACEEADRGVPGAGGGCSVLGAADGGREADGWAAGAAGLMTVAGPGPAEPGWAVEGVPAGDRQEGDQCEGWARGRGFPWPTRPWPQPPWTYSEHASCARPVPRIPGHGHAAPWPHSR
jgi:hypothetical protein